MLALITAAPYSLILMAAIGTVWSPPITLSPRLQLPRWLVLAVLALGWATLLGALHASGWLALAALLLSAWAYRHAPQRALRLLGGVLTLVLALALAMHKLPGFVNPVLLKGVLVSPDGLPFTQYANLDKACVGLVLLALVSQRLHNMAQLRTALRCFAVLAPATVVTVMAAALASGFVRIDAKLPAYTLQFIVVNLFFTVIAEETFFRGLIQGQLTRWLEQRWPQTRWIGLLAVLVSALLFGAAHLGGGPAYAALAALAGVGYAYAYHATGRIEAAIATHLLVNAVHFLGFTYPALAS
ncbi:CPBP family intramembrane metalloprotease [Pseudoduganella sp. FT93W]|uniref:CPBP family intramembrane metalloprotease n=1 Tax=Duganella fentianensis TaxID=2692177 RepID=A0A845HUG2_9BURK|nr:CPBP family intramembrane glutamic endopeptidase [Duganella fentianensis]MYN44659.1 CPBP family intramembrane metalloprotease [Duganella fentianensis]